MSGIGARSAVLLVDNGTLEPAAIRRLRMIAAALAARLRSPVEPVSLLHSDRVPAEQIDGQAAEILEAALMRRCGQGILTFTIVPFFIGPTRALSDYLPQVIERVRVKFPALLVRVWASMRNKLGGAPLPRAPSRAQRVRLSAVGAAATSLREP